MERREVRALLLSRPIETIPTMRVLVIDDDAGYLRLITLVLQRYGYEVLSATTGEQGAELAGQADVALVDMIMPHMTGLETIPLLQWSNPSLTIFASSGSSQNEFKRELDQLGVHVFLPKPFPAALLIHQLQQVTSLATA